MFKTVQPIFFYKYIFNFDNFSYPTGKFVFPSNLNFFLNTFTVKQSTHTYYIFRPAY